jgi:hypothetical protein
METARGFSKRITLGLALVFAGAAWAGTASADHGHWKKKRHHNKSRHTEVVFVGGSTCGSRVYVPAHPVYYAPPARVVYAAPRVRRVYYDPYCGERFASLGVYYEHLHRHSHASVAWVIEGGVPLYGYRRAPDGWVRFGFDFAVSR